ncbi:MAG: aminotransferase class III-fold pyridoxal phosphate-dependent enzyme [Armatimonadetes bacterium]|nr:aminotransferase class III-fold pyridoxal phosphate-dependent enzyme [Armatimonadota bacterium]
MVPTLPQVPVFPGPISGALLEEMRRYVVSEPYPFVLNLEKCEGMYLETVEGIRLFDWAGYFGSKLVGHNHPRLYEPDYVKRLTVAANNKVANPDFLTPECLEFYRTLNRIAPKSMKSKTLEVYAVNSGAEAVENMMKYMISRFNAKKARNGRVARAPRFIYFEKAFHGRTVFALGVTQTIDETATRDFHGLTTGGNIKLPFPSVGSRHTAEEKQKLTRDALKMVEMALSQMSEETVGIIVEPIQGAGGQRCALPEFFVGLSELCHKFNVYLAFDEVQTGGGATGEMFAIDHFDLPHPPIAVATGKKFGCGVVYMHEPLDEIGVLDSTWGGTLADMVRVVQEFKIVEDEGLVERARENGEFLRTGLLALVEKHPTVVQNVRGMGLYQGFQLFSPAAKREFMRIALEEHQLLLLGAGIQSIRTRPNLSVTREEISEFLAILDQICSKMEAS